MNWIDELHHIPKFRKYSQSGEEGYLQHILNYVGKDQKLVDLGAWDGVHLSNSRYFIEKGYHGILIDGDNRGNSTVLQKFITKDNVCDILYDAGADTFFDLLSIDLDGNDLYILESLLTDFMPTVVIAEFNPIWAPTESKVITYDENHTWGNDDYYGFSFLAGIRCMKKFGYHCVFQNDNLNMYFVAKDLLAESLDVAESDIPDFNVQYAPTRYHPVSKKQNWIDYV